MSEFPHLMLSWRLGSARSAKRSLLVDILLVLLFKHLEEQRELGHFNGLLVDIDAEDIVKRMRFFSSVVSRQSLRVRVASPLVPAL